MLTSCPCVVSCAGSKPAMRLRCQMPGARTQNPEPRRQRKNIVVPKLPKTSPWSLPPSPSPGPGPSLSLAPPLSFVSLSSLSNPLHSLTTLPHSTLFCTRTSITFFLFNWPSSSSALFCVFSFLSFPFTSTRLICHFPFPSTHLLVCASS